MWPGNELLLLVVAPGWLAAGVWSGGRWRPGSACRIALGEGGSLAALGDALGAVAGRCGLAGDDAGKPPRGGRRVRVLLADAWFDGAPLPWNPRALGEREQLAHARATLANAGVELAEGDVVRVADAPYRQPRWAIAYPQPLLRRLADFCAGLGATLESVAPLGVAAAHALRRQLPAPALFALADGAAVSLWHGPDGSAQLLAAADLAGAVADAGEVLDRLWRRVRLRDPRLAGSDGLAVVDIGGDGASWPPGCRALEIPGAPQDDGFEPALRIAARCRDTVFPLDACQRQPRFDLRLLAVASLLAGLVLTMAVQAVRSGSAEAEVAGQLAAQAAAQAAASAPRPAPAWSKGELQRIVAINAAVRELNLPVASLLQAIQPPRDIRVGLLSVEFSPGRGNAETPSLKLSAESRTGEEMARYAAYLAERRPLVDAYLLSHEVAENDRLKPYRFTVEAKWRD